MRALAGAVQAEGRQAYHHHHAKNECPRPQRPVDTSEARKIGPKAHVDRENERRAAERELRRYERHYRDVHMLPYKADAHRALMLAGEAGMKLNNAV